MNTSFAQITPVTALLALAVLFSDVAAQDHGSIEEPSGYRMGNYGSTVPLTVSGAKVIETAQELQVFLQENKSTPPALIDVYPAQRKPDNFSTEDIWIEPSRETIEGAIWLANTGMGVLPVALENLFTEQLKTLTGNKRDYPVVIFCEPRCWHSWNAAKRAVSLNYTNIHWYRQGVTDWQEAGLPTQSMKPVRP